MRERVRLLSPLHGYLSASVPEKWIQFLQKEDGKRKKCIDQKIEWQSSWARITVQALGPLSLGLPVPVSGWRPCGSGELFAKSSPQFLGEKATCMQRTQTSISAPEEALITESHSLLGSSIIFPERGHEGRRLWPPNTEVPHYISELEGTWPSNPLHLHLRKQKLPADRGHP